MKKITRQCSAPSSGSQTGVPHLGANLRLALQISTQMSCSRLAPRWGHPRLTPRWGCPRLDPRNGCPRMAPTWGALSGCQSGVPHLGTNLRNLICEKIWGAPSWSQSGAHNWDPIWGASSGQQSGSLRFALRLVTLDWFTIEAPEIGAEMRHARMAPR